VGKEQSSLTLTILSNTLLIETKGGGK
jgi:hypothetical protein